MGAAEGYHENVYKGRVSVKWIMDCLLTSSVIYGCSTEKKERIMDRSAGTINQAHGWIERSGSGGWLRPSCILATQACLDVVHPNVGCFIGLDRDVKQAVLTRNWTVQTRPDSDRSDRPHNCYYWVETVTGQSQNMDPLNRN